MITPLYSNDDFIECFSKAESLYMNPLELLSKYRSSLMGVAILWIIVFHYPIPKHIPFFSYVFMHGYSGVDIFLFLSAFGLYYSMRKNGNILTFYKKRFCRIFPIYWFVLLLPIYKGVYGMSEISNIIYCATTIGYWINKTYLFWYVSCIVVFYAFFPLYYRLLNKRGLKISIISLVLAFMLMSLYALFVHYKIGNFNTDLIFSIARIPVFIIGSILGYYMYDNIQLDISNKSYIVVAIMFLLAVISLYLAEKFMREYLLTASLCFIPFIVITPVLCVCLSHLFRIMPHFISVFFSYIGRLSLELYFSHICCFEIIKEANLFNNRVLEYLVSLLISFVLAFLLHIIDKYALRKMVELICSFIQKYSVLPKTS